MRSLTIEYLGSEVSKEGDDIFCVYIVFLAFLLMRMTKMTKITKVTPAAIPTTVTQKFDGGL